MKRRARYCFPRRRRLRRQHSPHTRHARRCHARVPHERREAAEGTWLPAPAARARTYGIKNVKWIVEIEAYAGDYPATGNARAGRTTARSRFFPASIPLAIIKHCGDPSSDSVASPSAGRIDQQSGDQFRCGQDVEFDCEIETPMSPYSWVIWNYTWRPPNQAANTKLPSAPSTQGTVADCGNYQTTAGGGLWISHHYRGCGVSRLKKTCSFVLSRSNPST